MGMYHWEADQEDFLLLAGEALLIIEGEERPLRHGISSTARRDEPHNHRRRTAPCAVLAVGAREHGDDETWGGYPVDETAQRPGVGVDEETHDARKAYAGQELRRPTRYRDGWLPGA